MNSPGVARRVAAAVLLLILGVGAGLRAADTEYYRHYDSSCVEAMLDYAWTRLAPAVQARCAAAGQPGPLLSAGRWHSSRDTRVYWGPVGWSCAENSAGLRLSRVRFRDADGDGRHAAAEYVWLDADADAQFDAGEALLSGPAGAGRIGDHGRAFRDRLYAHDANGDGVWSPGEDVWQETAAADRADLAAIHAALIGLLGGYVNHLEEPAWDGGTTFARSWTTGMILTALGQTTLLAPPAALDGSFAAARDLAAWLRQAVAMVELLQVRLAAGWSASGRAKSASAYRGPYYQLHYLADDLGLEEWSWRHCREGTLTLDLREGVAAWPFSLEWTWSGPCASAPGGEGSLSLGCSATGEPPAYRYTVGGDGSIRPELAQHSGGASAQPWYLGDYESLFLHFDEHTGLYQELTGQVHVSIEAPPRTAFWLGHSLGGGGSALQFGVVLPSSTAVAALFASEWAAAEWQATGGGLVRAYRWESDTSGCWPDAHESAIRQEWAECTATLQPPAGVGVEVYVYVAAKQGTPDLFAGKDAGRFWHWSTLPAGSGDPVTLPFAPAGFPSVPNPVYPGGDYEATTWQSFSLHGVLDYRGTPGFAALPVPPGVTPPPTVSGTRDPDTNRDDLVDVGADLASFGPDTGTLVLRPEWVHPQVMLPLAVALWDELPVHAYLCQGAVDDGPNLEWLHPDAEAQPLAFSLHSRAAVEQLVITPAVQRKIVTVVRPRGNRVAFEFAWDAGAAAFSALGFPLAPNQRRTYVLRDLTPANDLDACFELHFDSGVIHVYAGASQAEGALTRVRHVDGRAVETGGLSDCAFDLNANTFTSPRCHGTLAWSGGLLRRLDYTWRCGSGTLGVDLVYASTPAGAWVTGLQKTIPELGVSHPGGFGFAPGPQVLVFGSGVTVSRDGGSLTTVWPSGSTLTRSTTLNADGLPTRLETAANGSSHAIVYEYAGGNRRCPANGAAAWAQLVGVVHPDGSWERFAYEPASGWLAAHIMPWADAAATDPEPLCQVERFGYDCALSAGDPADPGLLVERPRSAVVETLGSETARTYHAYAVEAGRRTVRTRRCAAVGAAWDDAGNLESVQRCNPRGPPDLTTPTGWVHYSVSGPRDDRLTLTAAASSGQTTIRVLNALGQTLSSRRTEVWHGFPLVLAEDWSGIDPFGRIVRTDHLDGTCERFTGLQWHGGPLQHTHRDGSVESFTYFPDGRVRSRSHYGVTAAFTYDALGNVVLAQHSAGTLAVQTLTRRDSQGRQTFFEDELGRCTRTTYSGPDRTVVYPDGSRLHEERFLDGALKRRSGSAVSEERHERGVDTAGIWSCTKRDTPAGFVDLEYVHTDPLGRVWQSARTLDSGPARIMSTTVFDAQGRPCRSVDADGVTALTAYNARNEISQTAIDMDADGRIGAGDRITAYDRQALVAGDPLSNAAVAATRHTVTTLDGSVTQSFTAADGRRSWSVTNGRVTHTATVLGAGPGVRTVTTTFPDGSARVEDYDEALLRRLRSLDARGVEIASETYEYDALRRPLRRIDGRTGVASTVALDAAGQVIQASRSDTAAVEEYDYDPMGRTTRVCQRGGGEVFYDYDPAGRLTRAEGADTPPCDYLYDPRGLTTGLRTWRDRSAGSGDVLTEWRYSDASARLTGRRLAGTPVQSFTYSAAGRPERLVRHLPGGDVVTTFSRDASGAVVAVSHSDGSPGVTVVRDLVGRPLQITDASGSRTVSRDLDGRILTETLPQLPGAALVATYDAVGRRTALTLTRNGTDLVTWTRSYDAAGRLESVSDGRCSARYEYLAGSNRVERTVCTAAGGERLRIEHDWDSQGRLAGLLAYTPGSAGQAVASWQYTFDPDGRRIAVEGLLADPADPAVPSSCRWDYAYDLLGQLSSAVCRDRAGGAVLAGRDFVYGHDDIGNRRRAGRRDTPGVAGEEYYSVNDLNQYTLRSVPGALYISGVADPAATVTVNGIAAARAGTAFHLRLPVDNRAGPVSLALAIRAVRQDTAKGGDLMAEVTGTVSVPAASELFAAAGQGGLAADSLHACEWDINDRLMAVTPTGPAAASRPRVEFIYDAQGRRIAKRILWFVVPPAGGPGSWALTAETCFVYDNWTLLAEFAVSPAGDPALVRSCLWGLDLAGRRNGQPDDEAGGIGGLIASTSYPFTSPSPSPAAYFTVADANGNLAALVDADPVDPGRPVVETLDYEPFGRVLTRRRRDAGPIPAQAEPLCPFGFASKYVDSETGLAYFGLRYYSPDLGRWLCRDPLEEQGGPNLYAYCQNDPINHVDPLGLALYAFDGTGTRYETWTAVSMLHRAYQGNKEYEEGVGSHWYSVPLGGVFGMGADPRLERMYERLTENFRNHDTTIDIIGFSRGAALAREFANMISSRGDPIMYRAPQLLNDYVGTVSLEQCSGTAPSIRFVGLFDTVGSFGIPGNQINLGIRMDLPDNVQNTAHAVARHERRAQFPSTPLNPPHGVQVFHERAFDGDHSDIGSGHGQDTNRLSLPPLEFIWQEGRNAGVPFGPLQTRPWPIVDSIAPHDLTGMLIYTDGGWRRNLPQ